MGYRAETLALTGKTADVDAAVSAAKGLTLLGYSCRESAGTPAVASFNIVNGADADDATKLAVVELAANQSKTVILESPVAADAGLSLEVLSGQVDVNLLYRLDNWDATVVTNTTQNETAILLIHDEFDGAADTEINGRTPDTLNTPGNLWTAEANLLWELNGSGAAVPVDTTAQANGAGLQIDSGITSNLQRAEVQWSTPGGGNNLRCRVFILGDGAWDAGAGQDPNDCLYFSRDNTGGSLNETIAGTNTVLASVAMSATIRTGDIRRIQNDAGTIRCFEGAGEFTGLATVYSVPAGLDGNPFMGIFYAGNFASPSPYGYFKGWNNV